MIPMDNVYVTMEFLWAKPPCIVSIKNIGIGNKNFLPHQNKILEISVMRICYAKVIMQILKEFVNWDSRWRTKGNLASTWTIVWIHSVKDITVSAKWMRVVYLTKFVILELRITSGNRYFCLSDTIGEEEIRYLYGSDKILPYESKTWEVPEDERVERLEMSWNQG